ncbi:regulatory protein RecX [Hufsiella ginkgonis]|uniref:Regulatory protein RecX n=1 Tax=Hufsiella ginkgonis TaxID=2695274 RepID=A0A7K1XYE0_9SPHI|nr:regulatory protein RecX [Hufsiella ginkgonis]MXV15963.1 RecX family transcriptional regulator [Hufsiella ginkgonis]
MPDPKLLTRIENYCVYRERAQQEVRDKLYEWGVFPSEVEATISALIEGNFLNEERFANAYASGKFRIKRWGKTKIKQGLKLRKVPDKLIAKALNGLDAREYEKTLKTLLEKKSFSIKEQSPLKRRYQLMQFAYGKGFESDLIVSAIEELDLQ